MQNNQMNYNILVVDDEKELADVIELYLTAMAVRFISVTRVRKLWTVSHIRIWTWRFWM